MDDVNDWPSIDVVLDKWEHVLGLCGRVFSFSHMSVGLTYHSNDIANLLWALILPTHHLIHPCLINTLPNKFLQPKLESVWSGIIGFSKMLTKSFQ